ncbi:MAG: hypothetical protein BWK80_26700 [Desulfobacteraceae bacterium IS3]|nr:MAG: hypothetical protein BWK80_26700 [Desulfobacteraceae bacterium IS3]
MAEIVKKAVCKCEKCGNEAEMTFTCTLDEEEQKKSASKQKKPAKVKGTGTCSHCGNEADMWIDM